MTRSCSFLRTFALLLAVFLAVTAASGQTASARFDATRKVFRLDSATTTYAFGINERNELQPLYWGARLGAADTLGPVHITKGITSVDTTTTITPQEFAGWGQGIYTETALKISFADGNRDLVLHYDSHTIKGNVLLVVVKDIQRNIVVTLRYEMDQVSGLLARSAHIENHEKARLVVDEASAGTWVLPSHQHYRLTYLSGRWGAEFQPHNQEVAPGKTVLESRRGSTSHQSNPWFAIQATTGTAGQQDEETGEVWFGALAWSGSWRIAVEQDPVNTVRVTGGYNPFDFAYGLAPGESLDTPVFYGGYTPHGMGEVSRILHRFELAKIAPQAPSPRLRPVLYNSWEATRFTVDAPSQMKLADTAAKLGVERFVVDDAWFGKRTTDKAGLGDWTVNLDKFPGGLKPLIDHVRSLGMDFGLWVEPEMVNPDSDLYRAHPEWVLNFPGRPRTEHRSQLTLNLARPDVRAFIFKAMDDLLTQNQISFFKWDYNRTFAEPGWPDAPNATVRGEQEKLYVRFTNNLYSILAELRLKHPGVEIESCASGGGRVDLGILHYADQVWPSDNMDAFDRLRIQNGMTYAYSPSFMQTWVTHSPDYSSHRIASLQYRFLSAMQGALGIGDDLRSWTEADSAQATKLITAYKQVRATIQHGSLYRLISPEGGSEKSATGYVSTDRRQAVLFAFLHSIEMGYNFPTVYPKGLDPEALYTLTSIAGKANGELPKSATGAYWMHMGIDPDLRGDFTAAAFRFDQVK